MLRKFIFLLFLLSLTPITAWNQSKIQTAIDDFVRTEALQGAAFSICVMDVATGKTLGEYQPDTRLTPASVQKLVTPAGALDLLGPDFQFKTQLGYSGTINAAGTLTGDLIILGGGDPALASEELEEVPKFYDLLNNWAEAIKAAGIKKINGKIIGDGSYYSGYFAGPGWPWEDLGNYYGAGIWGLNIMENSFNVNFQLSPDKSVQPQLLSVEPGVPNLLLLNELTTGDPDSGDQAFIFGGPFSYKRWIRGTLPQKNDTYTIYGSLPDPAYFTAFHLREKLKESGINSIGASTQIDAAYDKPGLKIIQEIKSPKLSTLVKAANYESINLYCEVFLRQIAEGEKSGENGLEKLNNWLLEKGFAEGSFILKDGSGLSPQNAISAGNLTRLIQLQITENAFRQSLPTGGIDGTAKYIFKNSMAKGNIFLKSGSMSGVRAYAGIIGKEDEEQLAFSIIANNFSCKSSEARKEMEKLMEQIYLHR